MPEQEAARPLRHRGGVVERVEQVLAEMTIRRQHRPFVATVALTSLSNAMIWPKIAVASARLR
jgi:hypothetical protein